MNIEGPVSPIESLRAMGVPALQDAAARGRALDEATSFLVQAPAGSGKTELLTDRFPRLLSVVDEPEQVLAITFTRGATAEMRSRVIGKLLEAERDGKAQLIAAAVSVEAAAKSRSPAADALRRSQQRGWNLLEQPQRLRIETIDSLCMSIAHRMPLLARMGGNLHPTENAGPLYDLAAQRVMQALGGANETLNEALKALLTLRDNRLANCEQLIAEMLWGRDQWSHLFLLSGAVDWDSVRRKFEQPFEDEICRALGKAHALLNEVPGAADELIELGKYACQNLDADHPIRVLANLEELPPAHPEFVAHWGALTSLVLVQENTWRKGWTKDEGFPAKGKGRSRAVAGEKERIKALTLQLERVPGLLEALCDVRRLPPARYTDAQWDLLLKLFTALRFAVAELKVIFAERGVVDFAELGLAAEMVLGAPELMASDAPGASLEHALAIGDQVRHLLVDEFQDTSRRQHQLLSSLLRGWDTCDGRTCFFVGDPMQSIYLFRQAEVELFSRVGRHGLECESGTIELETLKLQTNFRSHSGLVDPLNKLFAAVFKDPGESHVSFTPSVASEPGPECQVHVHAGIMPRSPDVEQKRAARQRETDEVLRIVRSHLPNIQRAQRSAEGSYKIGILVRIKKHAASIAAALRDSGIRFRAMDLEPLRERQEILDLLALIRALAHPMDRVAWLSVLRAPWCGLELRDLHALCGTDLREGSYAVGPPILELLQHGLATLSPEGQRRAARTRDVLLSALEPRNRLSATMSFAVWIERTWIALGGNRCVDSTGLENVLTFFGMLDELEQIGVAHSAEAIDAQLVRLFAQPDTAADERAGIQVMTIHKAKGLGFDVVIVPGLDRGSGPDKGPLVSWLQRFCTPEPVAGPADEVLVAPIGQIGQTGQKQSQLYRWVREQHSKREVEERKRLLYVACTRASGELHLLGAATESEARLKPGEKTSLLATAWPGLEAEFVQAVAASHGVAEVSPTVGSTLSGADNIRVFVSRPEVWNGDGSGAQIAIAAGAIAAGAIAAGAGEDAPGTKVPGIRLRRLPFDLTPKPSNENVTADDTNYSMITVVDDAVAEDTELYGRPEGSLEARALGTAVHALFEKAARQLACGTPILHLRAAVPGWRNQAASILRNHGVVESGRGFSQSGSGPLSARAVDAVKFALDDPMGLWILGPHAGAQSETAWTGFLDGTLRTLRVDRIFRAASEPLVDGDDCLWIIDYKTASHSAQEVDEFLQTQRLKYQKQLEMYGKMLRLARGSPIELRLGLYYPFLKRLDSWSMG